MFLADSPKQLDKEMIKAYWVILKPRLSFLVVISTILSYLYASEGNHSFLILLELGLFGFFITGSANTFNQIIEMELDSKMDRTKSRPLPTQTLSPKEAYIYGAILLFIGLLGLFLIFNVLATLLSFISFLLYVLVYTPLKRITPLSVLVGAFPGAIPILVGCVAASGNFYPDYLILFGIQFFWQFPHFWAIAWVLDDDYQKAGFFMLPFGRGKDSTAAYYIFIYTVAMVLVSLFPSFLQLVGVWYTSTATILGLFFLVLTVLHMRKLTNLSARRVMFFSFFYLPIVQLLLAFDKI
jgi:protoheme IX farnesyltransferase